MPKLDGLEISNIIKEKYPTVKILLVSGYSKINHTENSKAHYDNLIIKPFDASQLLRLVREILDS